MSTEVLALVVAIVGVLGTLASALLTQTLSLRSKRLEIDEQRQLRIEERDEEQKRTEFKDRRDSCIALNMAARNFRQALKNCLFEGVDKRGVELEEARQAFTSRYGEAQMILSDTVLKVASTASGRLAEAYGKVKASQQPGVPPLGASEREKVENFLDHEVGPVLRQLRQVMRSDLGVTDQDQVVTSTARFLRNGRT
jgi:Flp pilus assembly protein TadB